VARVQFTQVLVWASEQLRTSGVLCRVDW